MTLRKLNGRSLLGNITLINGLLVICAGILASLNIAPMFSRNFTFPVQHESTRDKSSAEGAQQLQLPSSSDYVMVGENNLFHPERIIPAEKKEEKPLPKPEIVLYGTMISGDMKIAYMEDLKAPKSTPGRGRRQLSLRKGDSLGGFVLKDISTDKIVMVRGEEVLTVSVYDSHKKAKKLVSAAATAAKAPQAVKNIQKPSVPMSENPTDQKAFQFFEKLKREASDR